MTQIAIVADDLTGAADAAALFAQAGLATVVPLAAGATPEADVLSVSTESRELPPDQAAARVRAAVDRVLAGAGRPPAILYKKLDSALRGQIGPELVAAMAALGERRAVVAPALPAERRTTVGGCQYVGGVPLERSAFGGPGVDGNLVRVLRGCARDIPVTLVGLDALRSSPGALDAALARDGIVVADAETDADLDAVARSALAGGLRLLAGSAGLARALVRVGAIRSEVAPPAWQPCGNRPVLVIAGTRHQATARQIERAAAAGIPVVCPDQHCLDDPAAGLEDAQAAVERHLAAGRHVVFTTHGSRRSPLGAETVADRLASIVDSAVVRSAVGGLLLTGGDVAMAVCRHLSTEAIWLRGEVLPAIPWGTLTGPILPGLPVVTKAGSFGDEQTILVCIAHLGRAA